jgi:hypothetical protein
MALGINRTATSGEALTGKRNEMSSRTAILGASAAIALMLAGCNPSAQEVGSGSYDPAKLSYFQDYRTGLCFAVSAYSRMDTGGRASGGLSHASVPCSDAVLKLARNPA